MPRSQVSALVILAMTAFAANSLLCRLALADGAMDGASFSVIRLLSGAVVLSALVGIRKTGAPAGGGDWTSAFALFVYAAGFSFAYLSLSAGTGALLLFAAVQATMIGHGLRRGERIATSQSLGLAVAFVGLVALLAPGLTAPPVAGACLMLVAGVAWGVYSLRGRGQGDPTRVTAGNFVRASALALPLALVALMMEQVRVDETGVWCALASGAIASGIGYAIWYTALPALSATAAATVQLSVPVIAAAGGVALLGEAITPRLLLASVAVLGGIALVLTRKAQVTAAP